MNFKIYKDIFFFLRNVVINNKRKILDDAKRKGKHGEKCNFVI